MRPEDLVAQLKRCANLSKADKESAHKEADELLLKYIHNPEITREFYRIHRRYA